MEQLDYNLLFRWFVGLAMDDAVWSPSTFSKNRDRLLDGDIAAAFFDADPDPRRHGAAALGRALHRRWDAAWNRGPVRRVSARGMRTRPRAEVEQPTENFHGQRRRNETHQSTTDPDARLYKKARGREARLGYLGHVLMEHRSGLIVNATVTPADGYGERDAALVMIEQCPGAIGSPSPPTRRMTRAASSRICARWGSTPHVAQYAATAHRRSAIDGRTTRHPGYADESATTETGGTKLRMDEDGGRPAEAASPRWAGWSAGSLPSRQRRTTSSACGDCCRPPHEDMVTAVSRLRASASPRPVRGTNDPERLATRTSLFQWPAGPTQSLSG